MKKFVLLFVFILSSFGFAQTTSNDIVMENNVNTKFLDSLVLSICNDSTQILKGFVRRNHLVTYKCSKYQSLYQSEYSVCNHVNFNDFKNIKLGTNTKLSTIDERKKFFNKQGHPLDNVSEVITFVVVEYGVTTYEELALHIVGNFFGSVDHKNTILGTNTTYGNFSCTQGLYKNQKGFYVTGVFGR